MRRKYSKKVPLLTLAIIIGSNVATYGQAIPDIYADPFQMVSVEVSTSPVSNGVGARSVAYASDSDFKVIIGSPSENPELLTENNNTTTVTEPVAEKLYQKTATPKGM